MHFYRTVLSLIFLAAIPFSYGLAESGPSLSPPAELSSSNPVAIEKDFKTTCAQLIQFLSQKEVSESDWSFNLKKYRGRLKTLVQDTPQSPWADDAQYLYAEFGDPATELVPELEYLLKHYPDSEAEPWTREYLNFIVPGISPLDLSVRTELGVNYLKLGQIKKLRELCASSIKKYPKKARLFKTLLKKSKK